jgi:hypothetical protein
MEILSKHIPGWLAMGITVFWIVLIPISLGPLDMQDAVRTLLAVALLISCLFFPVAMHIHPVATTMMLGAYFIELFWLIPLWGTKWKKAHES